MANINNSNHTLLGQVDSNERIHTAGQEAHTEALPLSSVPPEPLLLRPPMRPALPALPKKPAASRVTTRIAKEDHSRVPIVALDTEYQLSECSTYNIILSYQFTVMYQGHYCSGIIYTGDPSKKGRIKFETFLRKALTKACKEGVIEQFPDNGKEVIVVAHFSRADIFTFSDSFTNLKTKVKGVRKTVASLGEMYGVDLLDLQQAKLDLGGVRLYDHNNHTRHININFFDTILLSPAGYRSLDSLGKLVGHEKVELPEGYSIAKMQQLLDEQPAAFEKYAITDTIVVAKYTEMMVRFVQEELGLKRLPYTLGGMSVKAFKTQIGSNEQLDKFFGYERVKITRWPDSISPTDKPRTITTREPLQIHSILQQMAINCYHGGRNEAFYVGPTEIGEWHDYDAPSCYTCIALGLKQLDFDQAFPSQNPADYCGDTCGMALVHFNVPETVKYPPLPIRATGGKGLFFPRTGKSFCTAAEIELALSLGVEIDIQLGWIIPWAESSPRIFLDFMRQVRDKRKQHKGVNPLFEKLWKELGNSLYGKLAQGLRKKTTFELSSGLSGRTPPSELTNALFAMYITGFARALMTEMLNAIPEPYTAVSVTTDGFITNAPIDSINLQGPICDRFRKLYHKLDASEGEILEEKNRASQVIVAKTRGQATALASSGWEGSRITAKAGIKVPDNGDDHNDYFVMLYLERHPGTKVASKSFTSTRKMALEERDMLMEERWQNMNLETDCKRTLINPRVVEVLGLEHIAFDTVPHMSIEDAEFYRGQFDRWRRANCLKTLDDADSWEEFLAISTATQGSGLRIQKGDTGAAILKRMFLRAYTQEKLGLERTISSRELAEWLTENGYPTKTNEVNQAKRAKFYERSVPNTKSCQQLLTLLLEAFPELVARRLIA